jgi:hypothetical protein
LDRRYRSASAIITGPAAQGLMRSSIGSEPAHRKPACRRQTRFTQVLGQHCGARPGVTAMQISSGRVLRAGQFPLWRGAFRLFPHRFHQATAPHHDRTP